MVKNVKYVLTRKFQVFREIRSLFFVKAVLGAFMQVQVREFHPTGGGMLLHILAAERHVDRDKAGPELRDTQAAVW